VTLQIREGEREDVTGEKETLDDKTDAAPAFRRLLATAAAAGGGGVI